jgi:hypothetical protein
LKRLAAILLTGILSFNWIGYQLLNSWLENRANQRLEARLDENNYDESQLISLKVPATHLSYYNSSTQFERVDGQIELNGVQYKYVKRRLLNDSLELLCIPNQTAMRLHSAKNEFFRLVNDLQHNGQGKKSGSSKSFSPVDLYAIQELPSLGGLYPVFPETGSRIVYFLPSTSVSPAEQPPDAVALPC